jgi:hypothetical protein
MSQREDLAAAVERVDAWTVHGHPMPQLAQDVGIVLNAARDYLEALRVVDEVRRDVDGPMVVAVRTPATPDEYNVTLLPDEKFEPRANVVEVARAEVKPPGVYLVPGGDFVGYPGPETQGLIERNRQQALAADESLGRGHAE